jgi:hypothetical protein
MVALLVSGGFVKNPWSGLNPSMQIGDFNGLFN